MKKSNLAMAYAVKRKNRKAMGGMIGMEDESQSRITKDEQANDHMIEHAVEPSEEVYPDEENKPAQMLAHGGRVKRMAMGGVVDHDEPMEGDIDNFLSDEEHDRTPFRGQQSSTDEEELDRSGFNPPSHMENEDGDEDQDSARKVTLSDIMRKVRMRNMGR